MGAGGYRVVPLPSIIVQGCLVNSKQPQGQNMGERGIQEILGQGPSFLSGLHCRDLLGQRVTWVPKASRVFQGPR